MEAWAQTVSQRAACLAVGLAEHEDESIQKFPEFLVVKEPKAPLQISVGDVVHLTAVGVADKPAPRLVPARPPGPGAEGGDVSHARASQSARTAQPATQQRHGVPLVKCDAHAGCPRERDAGQVVEAHEGLRVVSVAVFHPPVQEYQCGEVENVPIQEQVPAHAQARSAPPAPPPPSPEALKLWGRCRKGRRRRGSSSRADDNTAVAPSLSTYQLISQNCVPLCLRSSRAAQLISQLCIKLSLNIAQGGVGGGGLEQASPRSARRPQCGRGGASRAEPQASSQQQPAAGQQHRQAALRY